jgi:hypothetical protein
MIGRFPKKEIEKIRKAARRERNSVAAKKVEPIVKGGTVETSPRTKM